MNTEIAVEIGITPAYAGRTRVGRPCWVGRRDHPRVCGENPVRPATCVVALGSPPRMRGEPMNINPKDLLLRITPAYAGRTRKVRSGDSSRPDHPRVCGENLLESHELNPE